MDVDVAVWRGASALESLLVPLDALEPFPDNPNRGDVAAVRASFERFGQLKPIVIESVGEGRFRIVAGHTMTAAAIDLTWTQIAAVENDFGDEEGARAFLLADNRTAELGRIDDDALAVQLAALRDLHGTGYTKEDHEAVNARLAALRNPVFLPSQEQPPALDERSQATSGLFEAPLLLDRETRLTFARHVKILEREWGIDGLTAVVVRAVREAAAKT